MKPIQPNLANVVQAQLRRYAMETTKRSVAQEMDKINALRNVMSEKGKPIAFVWILNLQVLAEPNNIKPIILKVMPKSAKLMELYRKLLLQLRRLVRIIPRRTNANVVVKHVRKIKLTRKFVA